METKPNTCVKSGNQTGLLLVGRPKNDLPANFPQRCLYAAHFSTSSSHATTTATCFAGFAVSEFVFVSFFLVWGGMTKRRTCENPHHGTTRSIRPGRRGPIPRPNSLSSPPRSNNSNARDWATTKDRQLQTSADHHQTGSAEHLHQLLGVGKFFSLARRFLSNSVENHGLSPGTAIRMHSPKSRSSIFQISCRSKWRMDVANLMWRQVWINQCFSFGENEMKWDWMSALSASVPGECCVGESLGANMELSWLLTNIRTKIHLQFTSSPSLLPTVIPFSVQSSYFFIFFFFLFFPSSLLKLHKRDLWSSSAGVSVDSRACPRPPASTWPRCSPGLFYRRTTSVLLLPYPVWFHPYVPNLHSGFLQRSNTPPTCSNSAPCEPGLDLEHRLPLSWRRQTSCLHPAGPDTSHHEDPDCLYILTVTLACPLRQRRGFPGCRAALPTHVDNVALRVSHIQLFARLLEGSIHSCQWLQSLHRFLNEVIDLCIRFLIFLVRLTQATLFIALRFLKAPQVLRWYVEELFFRPFPR